eukprot:GGOE01045216.1.p1 GENE.GGOE01045216.1~~GGOE01045216.1.p1  ORF type:complete len:213 (-),score=59.54 GGOE01045216.1:583-1221(-)
MSFHNHQVVITLDLEGTLIPDVWPIVAERTGVQDFKLTTREFPDFEVLMAKRIDAMKRHGLKLKDIEDICRTIPPLPGAKEALDQLRERHNVIILSDIVHQLGILFMHQLGNPTLFCNWLEVDADGTVLGLRMRQPNGKQYAVEAFHSMRYKVVAAGDSYNDINMLQTAERGVLINAPPKIADEYPQFPIAKDFKEFGELIEQAVKDVLASP